MTDRSADRDGTQRAPSISADAEVMVLGRHGYETVVKGKNGLVASWSDHGCLRSTLPSSESQDARPNLL
jgi:hypothetical protein